MAGAEQVARDEQAVSSSVADEPVAAPKQRTVIRPMAGDANRVSVTLSDKTLANLTRAKELLAGKDDDEVLCQALERLLDQIAPERRHERRQHRAARVQERQAAPENAQAASNNTMADASFRASSAGLGQKRDSSDSELESSPKAFPEGERECEENHGNTCDGPLSVSVRRRGKLAVRDAVAVESGGRCCFVAADGTRCEATAFIEVDHAQPFALGGLSMQANMRLTCSVHNAYFAERTFGPWRGRKETRTA
jgi:hypothetical protein